MHFHQNNEIFKKMIIFIPNEMNFRTKNIIVHLPKKKKNITFQQKSVGFSYWILSIQFKVRRKNDKRVQFSGNSAKSKTHLKEERKGPQTVNLILR